MTRELRQLDLGGEPPDETSEAPSVAEAQTAALPAVLAAEVRRIYVACYQEFTGKAGYGREPVPQWDGGEDVFGTRREAVWPKLARVITENGADPVAFIRAQFWARNDMRPPAPNTLLSPAALARYRVFCQKAASDARQEYEAYLLAVQGEILLLTSGLGWDYRRALRYALLDVSVVRASALFRYCLAAQEGLCDVSANFRDRALLQYVFQKDAYDAAWTDKIPTEFRHDGELLRLRILGGR